MYEEDYQKLLSMFKNSGEVPLETICNETVKFFESIRERLESGTEEEKTEITKMMGELSGKLMELVKGVYTKAGLSEEELIAFAEDPENFTPEQWQMMQEAKDQMGQQAKELGKLLGHKQPSEGKAIGHKPGPGKKIHKPNRDDWIRS